MRYELHHGDCLDILPEMEAASIDTIITDPPYGLSFMGKDWDHGVPGARFWREALRVAKPGAMLLAFGGTRTHHRLMVAIEDAGWEIRDVIMWVYGSGFPKSHDISKAIDKAAGAEREVVKTVRKLASAANTHEGWERPWAYENGKPERTMDITAPATPAAREWHGWGTALKPAYEPIIVAMKPLDGTFANNALTHGMAGLWIDGGRIPANGDVIRSSHNVTIGGNGIYQGGKSATTGAIDGRRWPANLIHDGSDEVVGLFPVTESRNPKGYKAYTGERTGKQYSESEEDSYQVFENGLKIKFGKPGYNDTGSAARFFYCAKASRAERNAGLEGDATNRHPTVKPLALMRYLARITRTPTGGKVLDMFAGSGSTGVASLLEGRRFVGIELDADYIEIARRRLEHAASKPVQPALFSNGAHQP